ncbi:hypothetical protein [Rhizobacter sp. Root1221]|uniref:hypothetical protein n=1 Tax=Rhizobacter sp. Root1221 TaxID=1736433 RepID=UPI0006F44438|nr:hypothetical protein [Rhizobacter sp. Root1221]KQW02229.1 hypothetical protein ASC87_13440 [Rhizobacter sp. Root1221]
MDRNSFQAQRGIPGFIASHYPAIPVTWPNRAVRRAVKHGCESRVPQEWRSLFSLQPQFRAAVKAL